MTGLKIAVSMGVASVAVAAVYFGPFARPVAPGYPATSGHTTSAQPHATPASAALTSPTSAARQSVAVARPLTYEIGEQALTEQADAMLAGRTIGQTPLGNARLRDLMVRLRDNSMTVSGAAETDSARIPVEISATPDVQAGRVLVHVTDAQMGGFPAPEPVRRFVEQYLQGQVDQALALSGAAIKSVEIGQGKLVINVRDSS